MKQFKDFNIRIPDSILEGDKIRIERVLGKRIVVHGFRIVPSKFAEQNNKECLHLQIEMNSLKYIIFTGSKTLMSLILQINKENFPFETTIVKNSERFEFT